MYKALKSAQNEIQEALLKFVDEAGVKENCACASVNKITQGQAPVNNNDRLESIENTLQFLQQKQTAQYEVLIRSVQDLNVSMANVVKLLIHQAKSSIETATTIPNIQPTAQGSDLKNVCVDTTSHAGVLPAQSLETPRDMGEDDDDQSAIEVDDAMSDINVDDAVPDVEEEEDEGIEVEEWTYKGRNFFKDSENTVYANNNGEIGDSIGLYDPVKNIVKKLPSN